MLVELRYSASPPLSLESRQKIRLVEQEYSMISPPLSLESRLSAVLNGYPCLTSTLEPGQKIRFPLEPIFNPDHLFFAVTIVRKRDAKCKRIFQYPSPSESLPRCAERSHSGTTYYALLFDCPTASELAHRAADPYMARVHYLSRPACGLHVHLGIALGSDGYEAECVEIYSYSDDGEAWEEGIRQTLLRLQHVGIWF